MCSSMALTAAIALVPRVASFAYALRSRRSRAVSVPCEHVDSEGQVLLPVVLRVVPEIADLADGSGKSVAANLGRLAWKAVYDRSFHRDRTGQKLHAIDKGVLAMPENVERGAAFVPDQHPQRGVTGVSPGNLLEVDTIEPVKESHRRRPALRSNGHPPHPACPAGDSRVVPRRSVQPRRRRRSPAA